jgi:hypothetical protein
MEGEGGAPSVPSPFLVLSLSLFKLVNERRKKHTSRAREGPFARNLFFAWDIQVHKEHDERMTLYGGRVASHLWFALFKSLNVACYTML